MTNIIVLGVDASSTTSGIALLSGRKFSRIDIWQRDKSISLPENLLNFHRHLGRYFPVDILAIERVSVNRNMDTTRKLAYFEAAAILMGAANKARVVQLAPSQARKLAHGSGKINKEAAYEINSKKRKLLPFKKGGSDQSDAMTLALAGREYAKKENEENEA